MAGTNLGYGTEHNAGRISYTLPKLSIPLLFGTSVMSLHNYCKDVTFDT